MRQQHASATVSFQVDQIQSFTVICRI